MKAESKTNSPANKTVCLSPKALDFLSENRFRDSKDWYEAHKPEYREYVVAPLIHFVNEIEPTMSEIDEQILCLPRIGGSISRVRRDTRFTHDKSLYRDTAWIGFMREKKLYNGIPAFFFEFSPRAFRWGMGFYTADTATLSAMRDMVLKDDPDFVAADKTYRSQSRFVFEGDKFKRVKFPDAPANKSDWLERKNLDFIYNGSDFEELFSPELPETLKKDFAALAPVYKFLMKAYAVSHANS